MLYRISIRSLPHRIRVLRTTPVRSLIGSTMSVPSKRGHELRIGTHDGTFHCDEALGCFMLKLTKEFSEAEVVRTRDATILKDMDVVIDVGGVYDPASKRFDHHQRDFDEVFGHGHSTKLSSAGLVYKHYGREIIASELKLEASDPTVEKIYQKVYKQFMEALDGIDNGVNQWVSDEPPRYSSSTDLSSRVGGLNGQWNDEWSPQLQDERFSKAMALTGAEFLDCVNYFGKVWLPGRKYVVEAIETRMGVHPSGEIFKLPCYCPWKSHLYELETELDIQPPLKFCLYEDDKGNWRIQCVSVTPGSFENRRSLPAAWRGLRDAELDGVTRQPGGIFVHAGGFIGGHKTVEGATAMAIAALTLE